MLKKHTYSILNNEANKINLNENSRYSNEMWDIFKNTGKPKWFSKLMITLSERERANLSINLHDTILQNLLYLLRELEGIQKQNTNSLELSNFKEIILDSIHLIRDTCNELRPPLLNELGLIASIQNLIDYVKLQCNFMLHSHLDSSIKNLEKDYELALYRIVQELLNNAMKHSAATEVQVSLIEKDQVIYLYYSDNGVGIDLTKIDTSFQIMGISGIIERVKSIDGILSIDSGLGGGLKVQIKLKSERNNE